MTIRCADIKDANSLVVRGCLDANYCVDNPCLRLCDTQVISDINSQNSSMKFIKNEDYWGAVDTFLDNLVLSNTEFHKESNCFSKYISNIIGIYFYNSIDS